jgi:very-short-patch-repair endonuclease
MRTQRGHESERQWALVAERQGGLVTVAQLGELGLTRQSIKRRKDSGLLVPVLAGVYKTVGVPLDWLLFVKATRLWLGSRGVLSHRTSGTLQGLLEDRTTVDVSTTGYLRSPHPRVQVHRVGQLDSRDLRYFDDMRITNPVRTVIDLAGVLPPSRFDHVIDEGRRCMLIAERPLREALDRLGGRGRSGTRRLSQLLDGGEFQLPTPGSPFERRLLSFLKKHELRIPERQYEIKDASNRFVARVDFAYPDLMVAIECDGKKHHFGRSAWEHDLERQSSLAALGCKVIHISWDMLVNRPQELLRLLQEALGQPSLL